MGFDSKHGHEAKPRGSAALFSVGVQTAEMMCDPQLPLTLNHCVSFLLRELTDTFWSQKKSQTVSI